MRRFIILFVLLSLGTVCLAAEVDIIKLKEDSVALEKKAAETKRVYEGYQQKLETLVLQHKPIAAEVLFNINSIRQDYGSVCPYDGCAFVDNLPDLLGDNIKEELSKSYVPGYCSQKENKEACGQILSDIGNLNADIFFAHERYKAAARELWLCNFKIKRAKEDQSSKSAFDTAIKSVVTGTWSVCNNSDEAEISVAISYKDEHGWVQKGWYNIRKGECRQVASGITSPYVYYYAQGGNSRWAGDKGLCAHPHDGFENRDSNCPAGYRVYKYNEVKIDNLAKHFRLTLRQ